MRIVPGIKQDHQGQFYQLGVLSNGDLVQIPCSNPAPMVVENKIEITGPNGSYTGGFLHGLRLRRVAS